uniref:Uncharacterized protein n=1 Tax=Leptobrachium leishanense TaxID=445787 RepID=A0A8C5QI32_9ANUR
MRPPDDRAATTRAGCPGACGRDRRRKEGATAPVATADPPPPTTRIQGASTDYQAKKRCWDERFLTLDGVSYTMSHVVCVISIQAEKACFSNTVNVMQKDNKMEPAAGEPSPKRPRGRPKGSKNKSPSKSAQKKEEASGEKRPRGRPRKWPQQEKKSGEEETEETSSQESEED